MNYQEKYANLAFYLTSKQSDKDFFHESNDIIRCYYLSLLSYYYKQWRGEDKRFEIVYSPNWLENYNKKFVSEFPKVVQRAEFQ